jgi:hypothetical protein
VVAHHKRDILVAANYPAIFRSLKHELLIFKTFVTKRELHAMVARFVPTSLPC